jgi:hypothetical protein
MGDTHIGRENNCFHSNVSGDILVKGGSPEGDCVEFIPDVVSSFGYHSSRYSYNTEVATYSGDYCVIGEDGTPYWVSGGSKRYVLNPTDLYSAYSYNNRKYKHYLIDSANLSSFDYTVEQRSYVLSKWQSYWTHVEGHFSGIKVVGSLFYAVFDCVEEISYDWTTQKDYSVYSVDYLCTFSSANFNASVDPLIVDSIIRSVESKIATTVSTVGAILDGLDTYELAREAVSSVAAFDTNNIENAKSLEDVTKMLPPFEDLLQIKKHPAKAFASLHLWLSYAAKPTLKDMKMFADQYQYLLQSLKVAQPKLQVKYASGYCEVPYKKSNLLVLQAVKVSLTPYWRTEAEKAQHLLDHLGLGFTLANGWDLVPYSFVIDWFVSVGDFLAQVDYALQTTNRFDVSCFSSSAKTMVALSREDLGLPDSCEGSANVTIYRRLVSPKLPPNKFTFGIENPTNHIFDGLALIVANW